MLDDVLTDLAAEGDRLEALVAPLTAEQWRTATPAAGWDIATTIAHLAWTDEVAVHAATDKEAWDAQVMGAIMNPTGYVDEQAAEGAAVEPAQLLARWQTARPALAKTLAEFPTGEKIMWFGPPMSPASMASARFMETWAHGLDVADALGVELEKTDRIKHVAHIGVRTRNYAFTNAGFEKPTEEFRVELTAPSGEVWTYGPDDAAQKVTGSADDFCRLVTQRVHRDDTDLTAVGADAEQWLRIAQAFAGPAGGGRPPKATQSEGN
ncbi:TIGR03084 family metal-binding protein [Nocardioides yefusunii]|uniref:TIGR03084 family metal-binding protein n=1 Tax=Nocardioides yefusunii TaxID=2500546 RepID=A0ABW1R1F5_9ACTN|nr:TIGR03084 family metal-binding protein [Nocardioides yefusunii]